MTSSKQGNSSSGRINVGPDDDPHQFSFQNNAESPHAQASSPYFPKNTATPTVDSHPFTYPPDENFTQTFSGDEKKHHMKKKTANSVVIHIRLGAGLTKEIICDLDDDVLELAKNFCSENNLSLDAVPIIIKMIKQQFAAMLQRIRENTTKTEDHAVEKKKSSNSQSSRSMTKDSIQESQTTSKRVEVYEKPQTKPKLIGKLDVLVGPNDIKELRLYQGQDPYEIAAIFCEEHHFPPQIVQALGKKLDDLKQAYESRKRTKESLHSSSNDTMNKEPELEGKTANFGGYIYPPEDNIQNQTSHFVQEPTEYRNPFTSKVNEADDIEPPIGSPNFNSHTLQKTDSISEHIPQDDIQYSDIPSRTDTESVHPAHPQIQPQTYTQVQAPQVYAEVQVLPVHAQAQVPQQTQNVPVNPTKNPFESEAANSYERWSTLIKEKNIVRQVGSPVFGPASKDGGLNETRDKSPVNLKTTKIYKDAIAMFGDKLPNTKALEQIEEDSPTNKKKDSGKKITKGQVSALVDRLYYRELEKGAVVEEIRQKTRLKREKDEAKELTFHPKITKLERSPQDRYKDHIDRVHASEELKSKQIQDSFTFRPKISEASIQIAKNRARSRSPIYTQLYTEGFAQKSNNEKWREAVFKEKHPFSPRLPDDLDKFLKSRPKENQKEFTNRLVNEAAEKEERKFKARREEHNNDRDPVTGQKFHQPAISHDKYYQNLKKREEEEYSRERSRTPDPHQASIYTYSQEGLSYIEIELKDIFDKLDGDNDGFISSEKIDLSKLDADMLNAILEIIEILENSHSKFDFNAFNSAVNQLKLENKIRDAIRKANPAAQNLNFFLEKTLESQDGITKAINHEHSDYFSQRKKEKTFTKKSDSSTASSNQTDNSNMKLPKHYQGILEKKFLEKS